MAAPLCRQKPPDLPAVFRRSWKTQNIKLSRVASNTLGKSGRAMLDALVAGQIDPEQLADLALGHLRAKIPQLRLALEGKIREHHRFLLKRLLHQLRFIESEIDLLDQRLEGLGQQDPTLAAAVARWTTVPGVDRVAAGSLAAEIGIAMEPFPTAAHWASWAGLCPGNCESAGKRLSGQTRKGSPGWVAGPASAPGRPRAPRTLTFRHSSAAWRPSVAGSVPLSQLLTAFWPLRITFKRNGAITVIWAAATSIGSMLTASSATSSGDWKL